MGICDYISFIQQNGQHVAEIEPSRSEENNPDSGIERSDWTFESYGVEKAVLVKVPKSFSRSELVQWKPRQFASYPSFETKYSWDDWEFDFEDCSKELSDYATALSEEKANDGIWESSQFPDVWLVVFTPREHDIFVKGEEIDPEDISYTYYNHLFTEGNRTGWGHTKKEMFDTIVRNFESGAVSIP